VVGFEEFKLVD